MKLKILVISAALILVMLILGTGMAFGSNERFLKSDPGVNFPDKNLENAVRGTIGKFDGSLHVSDLEKIINLKAFGMGITNLEGLEYCTNLQILFLMDNEISDLTPILNLPHLICVWLNNNKVQYIPTLSGLPELNSIFLDDNQISDISPFADVHDLMGLTLKNNRISDISPLAHLYKLQLLNIQGNIVNNIYPLANHLNLTSLDCCGNQINDISPLAKLNINNYLNLSNNKIADISPLKGTVPAMQLDLSGNSIVDISPLDSPEMLNPNIVYRYSLENNPLNKLSIEKYIPELQSYGIQVNF